MLGMLGQAIKGTHIHSKHVTMRKNKRIVVKSNMPMPIHIDGEVFSYPKDDVRQVTITSLPAAIRVIV
jgi:diacylglycerol kinase family enzyme